MLKPVGGGNAAGRALFGRIGKNVVLQVVAQGLEPSPAGQSYTVWLYRSPKLALRVGAVKVPKSGGLAARFPIPAELLAYIAGGAFRQIDVSLASDAAYEREVAQAKRQAKTPPPLHRHRRPARRNHRPKTFHSASRSHAPTALKPAKPAH